MRSNVLNSLSTPSSDVKLRVNAAFQFVTLGKNNHPPKVRPFYSCMDPSLKASDSSEKIQVEESLEEQTETGNVAPSSSKSDGFGESVQFIPLSQRNQQSPVLDPLPMSADAMDNNIQLLEQNRKRNISVAIASFAIAILNYIWQFTHPVTAVEILATMQSQSAPLTSIGNNGKPTVIDFWAPWCENCKVAAPTLQAVEQEYGERVNFIMVNGDDSSNWPLIELFGVDAIPHLALVNDQGDVETALIGPMSRNVLRADIDALLSNRKECDVAPVCHEELPYKMFDAFWNRPNNRRINFLNE